MQISISAGNLQLTVTIDAGMILVLIVAFKSIIHFGDTHRQSL